MSEIIKKYHLFWAWQDDLEEKWLTKMANQGLHFQSYHLFYYRFLKGAPQKTIYRLDYQMNIPNVKEYLQIYEECGWEHCGTFSGWYFFRTESSESTLPELYTDKEYLPG